MLKQAPTAPQRDGGKQVQIVASHLLAARTAEIRNLVACRAYELYGEDGDGRDLDAWLRAEAEILYFCRHDLRETPDALVLRVEVPEAFPPDHLQVSVEPGCLTMSSEQQARICSVEAKRA